MRVGTVTYGHVTTAGFHNITYQTLRNYPLLLTIANGSSQVDRLRYHFVGRLGGAVTCGTASASRAAATARST